MSNRVLMKTKHHSDVNNGGRGGSSLSSHAAEGLFEANLGYIVVLGQQQVWSSTTRLLSQKQNNGEMMPRVLSVLTVIFCT